APVDLHETRPGLDQSPRHQAALPESKATVSRPQIRGLALQVEDLAAARRDEQRKSLPRKLIVLLKDGRGFQPTRESVEASQETFARRHAVGGDTVDE